MGKTAGVVGSLFIVTGIGVILLLTILSFIGLLFNEEVEFVNENNFRKVRNGVYQCDFNVKSTDDEIKLSIYSNINDEVNMKIIITDKDTELLYQKNSNTPHEDTIKLNSIDDSIKFVIEWDNLSFLFEYFEISITREELSDLSFYSCCSWFIIVPLSILIIIFGIILLIIQFVFNGSIHKFREKRKENKLIKEKKYRELELKRIEESNRIRMERKRKELEIKDRQMAEQEKIKQKNIKLAEKYERAERFEDAAKIYEEWGMIDKAKIIRKTQMIYSAQKYERAERYEDAAKTYESLNMWDEAGRARRKGKGTYHKSINVNVNDLLSQIRSGGLTIPYNCPNCGGSLRIDGNNKTTVCPYCSSPIDTDTLSDFIKAILI